ncbi:unnamed protein product, partial [Chrysoparadoxa australica]
MGAGDKAAHTGVLTHAHLFGIKREVHNKLIYTEEQVLAYPCGHGVLLHNLETKEQSVIGLSNSASHGVTALGASPNRKMLALTKSPTTIIGGGILNIYDPVTLKRRKVLNNPDLGSEVITGVSFSPDGKLCLVQGGAPDWTLALWSAEKAPKIVCSMRVGPSGVSQGPAGDAISVSQADFCTSDPGIVCVTGDHIIYFFRVSDGLFKPIPISLKTELQYFTCHAWLPEDKLVVASKTGDLLLFENLEFRCILGTAPGGASNGIEQLAVYSKGFVTGGQGGQVSVYERSDDPREFFRHLGSFHIGPAIPGANISVTDMTVSMSEDTLALCTSENQLFSFGLGNTDMMKEDGMAFEPLITPCHAPLNGTARIHGVDVCAGKPLAVTVGEDKTLRLWNYAEKNVELIKEFQDTPVAVALHPSGLYVLVSFLNQVGLYSILIKDVKELKLYKVSNCSCVRFSNGGQYFVISSNSQVQVHAFFTCHMVANLKGHQGRIRSMLFRNHDRHLVTTSTEGQVFMWSIPQSATFSNTLQVRSAMQSAASTADFSRIFCLSDDKCLRELDLLQEGKQEHVVKSSIDLDVEGGLVAVSDKVVGVVLLGVNDPGRPGAIRAYKITPTGLSQDYTEFSCMACPVSSMRLNRVGNLLFVGGEDGSLAMFDVAEEGKTADKRIKERQGMDYTEEIFMTKADLDIRTKQIQALKNKASHRVDELTLNNEYQLRLKDMQCKERVKENADRLSSEVELDKRKYASLLKERREMEVQFEKKFAEIAELHSMELSELDAEHKQKISAEETRYQALLQEKDELNHQWDEENQALVDAHTAHLQQITDDYDKKVEAEQGQQRVLQEDNERLVAKFERVKQMVEEDADAEAEDVRARYMSKLSAERETKLRLKGENGIMKKKFSTLNKQVEDQRSDIRQAQDKSNDLMEAIHGLEKDIQGHRKEIREREETIADKEKRIYDLKKKNQELEKFKFVLDYKIKELKRQIEPRENEIADMKEQIEEMDLELDQYHKSNSALDLMIGELRLKMDGMSKEISSQQQLISQGVEYIDRFHRDLHGAVQQMGNHPKLKAAVVQLYKQYVQEDSVAIAAGSVQEGDMQKEYNRQREHLERNLEALKHNIENDMKRFHGDRARLNRESVVLTKEINELRREAKHLGLQQLVVERAMASEDDSEVAFLLGKGTTQAPSQPQASQGGGRNGQAKARASGRRQAAPPSAGPGAGSNKARRLEQTFKEQLWREVQIQMEQIDQL